MASSPLQRTMKYYRDRGFTVDKVEYFNQWSHTRKDLFGCIDAVGMGCGSIWGLQATSGDHFADHMTKITSIKEARQWILNGGRLVLVAWRKVGAKGKRKLWEPRIHEFGIHDFPDDGGTTDEGRKARCGESGDCGDNGGRVGDVNIRDPYDPQEEAEGEVLADVGN